MPPIDFVGLALSLLERAEVLVPQWLHWGHRKGRYWYVGDFDGGEGKSANVNLKTGAWGDNGRPGDAGKDLLSLFKRVFGHATMADAARDLMGEERWRQALSAPPPPPKPKRRTEPQWTPIHPVPDDAPEYRRQWGHYARGVPPVSWEYLDRAGRLLGVVARFDKSDGGKDVQPLSFCSAADGRRQWRYKAFAGPRPLYGLQRLGPPGTPLPECVNIVEGEKKADALYEALGREEAVLSWPGGCATVALADWTWLQGVKRVRCWPDADAQRDKRTGELLPAERQPGLAAMRKVQATLEKLGCVVQIVDTGPPGTHPGGWDAADAIAEGWTREQLRTFMSQVLADPEAPAPPAGGGSGGGSTPGNAARAEEGDPRWREQYVLQRGAIHPCVANVMLTLHEHALWRGVLAFDEFAQRVVKRRPAPYDSEDLVCPAEWTDVDDTRTAAWISRREHYVPSSGMVAEAANEGAHAAPFHPVLMWLRSLQHDGTKRLDHWVVDLLGVQDTPYARLVGRYFLVGACNRVLRPGCKFDYCLVLEGPQGRLKSTALRTLGGPWFSDTELDLQHKDSMSYIRGKLLHEFSELGSLARAEELRQKSFLSRQVDEFRPTYGRREIRCPRQVVFAGTTNQWQWNKDPTGGRRFWPLEVGDVNIQGLVDARDQLFAEAFAAALAGQRYWPDADEQHELFDPEQFAREAPDAITEVLERWMNSEAGLLKPEFTLADACLEGLKLDVKAMTKDVQTRVGIALRKLDCERVERRNGVNRFVYRRPTKKAASSGSEMPAQPLDEEVPF